jgi:LL-diaminopimelate aminotransferase
MKNFEYSDRIKKLPLYLFATIEQKIEEKRKKGVDIINLGIGDPDLPPDRKIKEALCEALEGEGNHRYSSSVGESWYREAVAEWFEERFGVDLDPENEITCVIGSKEGLANLARAFVNRGDEVLVPNPGYPVYGAGATTLCEGKTINMPLLEENNFLPSLSNLPRDKKLMYTNYPNNPIGATATTEFMKELSDFVSHSKTILAYDNAYSEMTYDDYIAPSMLQYNCDIIEFHSLSKTFNMTGFRIGFAVGNSDLVYGLRKVKSQVDSGAPIFIQKAAAKALMTYKNGKRPDFVNKSIKIFQERRDVCVRELNKIGLKCNTPKGTFYIWVKIDGSSMEFADKALDVGVVVPPGIGFGEYGEGYIRIALTQPKERIKEAVERLEGII